MIEQRGQSTKFSRWACRLTVLGMVLPELDPMGPSPDWIYLHTLTFRDPEPDYVEGRRRWKSFNDGFLSRGGRWGVMVPQYGEETRRLHFHLVTVDRWDAKETFEALQRYGFGRYNVRARPAWKVKNVEIHAAAWYLARYVARRVGWPEELQGMRTWGVFGQKHFKRPPTRTRDVRITIERLTLQSEVPRVFHDWYQWNFPHLGLALRKKIRADATETGHTIMREITIEQTKRLMAFIAEGDIVGVGEYRVGTVELKTFKDFKDSSKQTQRPVATHKVDFGTSCERREFDEMLPVGSDIKAFTPPAKSGDLVAVCVDGMRTFQGGTNFKGRVFKL